MVSDYDGDGKADHAVYRPSNGTRHMQRSSFGSTFVHLETPLKKPAVSDYDGDGKADPAAYRPSEGTWYLLRSTQGYSAVRLC